jgi:hypothetical protein|tara:strand:+ start:427 stop:582 length:156 start_codon:yes stop_codon:yes gene_type:complete
MRQQTMTLYICDFCNKEYKLKEGAEACEDKHLIPGYFSIRETDRNVEDLRE